MEKLLTISIAAYNVESYLRETLDSLIVSEVMDVVEVIIVNDGSSDKTKSIAEEYHDRYPDYFIYIEKNNAGWGSTVNTGLTNARGKYFKLLDGDDYYTNLGLFVDELKKIDADLVYTPFITFYDDSDRIIHNAIPNGVPVRKTVSMNELYFTDEFAMHGCTFRTEAIKNRIRITENCFYTDVEFILKSIENTKTIHFVPVEVYCYRLGRQGQSASVEGFRKHYKEHIHILCKLLKRYKKINNDTVKAIYKKRLSLMVTNQYQIFLHLEPTVEHAYKLKHFDEIIKKDYREFYKTSKKRIMVFRLLGINSYKYIVIKQ